MEERKRLATTKAESTTDEHHQLILIEKWTRNAPQRAMEDSER